MTLLAQMAADEKARREQLRQDTRDLLLQALRDLAPAKEVIVFGSLTTNGRFTENSDVDIALEAEPAHMSSYQLSSVLGERLGRRVDVVLLPECRFRDKIRGQGEIWTLLD
jgi:predicted nucleotidyltransferase